ARTRSADSLSPDTTVQIALRDAWYRIWFADTRAASGARDAITQFDCVADYLLVFLASGAPCRPSQVRTGARGRPTQQNPRSMARARNQDNLLLHWYWGDSRDLGSACRSDHRWTGSIWSGCGAWRARHVQELDRRVDHNRRKALCARR